MNRLTQPDSPDSSLPRALPGAAAKARPRWLQWLNLDLGQFGWAARHTEYAAILIGLLVATAFVPHVLSFSHRDDPQRRFLDVLPGRSLLESFEYRLYDERFARRGARVPRSRDKIAIIAIDDVSMSRIQEWPWPRTLYARLIDRLKRAGARVIGIDLAFDSPQSPGPHGELSVADKALIKSCAAAGNVVFPSVFAPQVRTGTNKDATADLIESPFTSTLDQPANFNEPALGYLPLDSDGGYRRYPFYGTISGSNVGGFATLACGLYQKLIFAKGDDVKEEAYEAAFKQEMWPVRGGAANPVPTRLAAFAGRDAPQFQHLLINYWGPSGTFDTESFAPVLEDYSDAKLKQLYNGRIVFVGATALILKDLFTTPQINAGTADTEAQSQMPGVEIHATVAAMLLDGAYIQPPTLPSMYWTLFGLTIFTAVWTEVMREHISRISRRLQERWHKRKRFRRLRIRIQDLVWFALYVLFSTLPLFLYWQFCVFEFVRESRWIVASYPLVSGAISSGVVLLFLFTVESSERRKVIHQVGLYMDADIMEEILAHPEEDFPRPRRTVATVMFTDLEGFTSYSETHDAAEVVAALNAFMTRMKPIIRRYRGTVDKYIGDAIMAYFGVPVNLHDHAERALTCAIELQEECVRFREDTGIEFHMRVGIHTGDLIAGSVGSEGGASDNPHMNYTVIGDTVNVASRLEGKNKEFGSWIMCSRATVEAAPGVAEVIAARAAIKGKSQEAEVFIVRGFQGQEPRDEAWGKRLGAADGHAELGERAKPSLTAGADSMHNDYDTPVALALPVGEAKPD